MSHVVRRCLVILGLLFLAQTVDAGEIRWSSCPDDRPTTSAAAIDCGVYETGDTLSDQPVRLALARLRHRPDRLSENPVIFVPGGPAEPAGLTPGKLSQWQHFQQQAGWPRDIVLFDPRATGKSRPKVACRANESDRACRRRIGASVPAELSMSAAVRDLHGLIEALDQGPAVLWAHSFGSFVVRALAARYPEDISAVILESPADDNQRDTDFADVAAARALERVTTGCGVAECGMFVPSPGALVGAWMALLTRRSLTLMTARVPWPSAEHRVTDETLRAGILFSQYHADRRADVVQRLRLALKDEQALAPLVAPVWQLSGSQSATSPAYWAMRCSIAPPLRRSQKCRHWSANASVVPMRSASTLHGVVVYANADIVTPSARARALLTHSPGLAGIGVASGGHQPLRVSACAQQRVGAWLARRARPPATSLCGG